MICNKILIIFELQSETKFRQSTRFWVYRRNFVAPIYKLPATFVAPKILTSNNFSKWKIMRFIF